MDELDKRIISILQTDGRASNAKIARKVEVSEGTVRRRLKRLIQSEIIHVVAIPNPAKIGYKAEAIIGIRVDPDKIEQVAKELTKLNPVSWVEVTTGAYDIFVGVTLPSSEDLGTFLTTEVGVITGVNRTETFVTLSVKKRGYGVAL